MCNPYGVKNRLWFYVSITVYALRAIIDMVKPNNHISRRDYIVIEQGITQGLIYPVRVVLL